MTRNDDPILDEVFGALAPIFRKGIDDAYKRGFSDAMSAGELRVSVRINEDCAAILRAVKAERGWSTTEAIRHSIALLGLAEDGAQ